MFLIEKVPASIVLHFNLPFKYWEEWTQFHIIPVPVRYHNCKSSGLIPEECENNFEFKSLEVFDKMIKENIQLTQREHIND